MAAKTSKRTAPKVPPGARRPGDRQTAKRARVASVTVPMDPQAVLDLEQARNALEQARARLTADRDVRVARILTQRREQGPTDDPWRTQVDAVRAEVDVAVADELAPLEKAAQDALDRVDATSRTYVFHALGNVAYERLLKAHKPTDDDHEQVQRDGQGTRALFHADTFGPALVEACCDELDEAEVDDMFHGDDWNLAELYELFMTAYGVNTQRTVVAR